MPSTPFATTGAMSHNTLWLRFRESHPANRLTLVMQAGGNGPVEIEFLAEGAMLTPTADALFALGYLPACELKYNLRIDGAVSPDLLSRAGEIFRLYSRWYGYRRQPHIHAITGAEATQAMGATLLFFSAGVDSTYSLLEAREQVQCLVSIVGADFRPEHQPGVDWLTGVAHAFGHRFGLPTVMLRTAARRHFDRMVTWDQFHGPFLAAMAHLLSATYGRALIAGTWGASGLDMPWGSHPEHEHRYSSAKLKVEHHLPATRPAKLQRLLEAGLTRHLRVCLKPVGNLNCGNCNKCLYLRTALKLLGSDERAAGIAFANPGLNRPRIRNSGSAEYWAALLQLAETCGEEQVALWIRKPLQAFQARQQRRQRLAIPDFHVVTKRLKRRFRAWSGMLFRN